MNFIMSYDRERDLIGFRLHEQEPAIQRIIVAVRAMRVYNQPRTVVNIWIPELLDTRTADTRTAVEVCHTSHCMQIMIHVSCRSIFQFLKSLEARLRFLTRDLSTGSSSVGAVWYLAK